MRNSQLLFETLSALEDSHKRNQEYDDYYKGSDFYDAIQDIIDKLRSYFSQSTQAEPVEGWKLAPIEPTQEMIDATVRFGERVAEKAVAEEIEAIAQKHMSTVGDHWSNEEAIRERHAEDFARVITGIEALLHLADIDRTHQQVQTPDRTRHTESRGGGKGGLCVGVRVPSRKR